ncbi:MAG: HD domain-containing protein [Acidobacteriaceae bacterium]|nr:HD domain-containing protein [Acidobacteriaceae bacterium]
MPLENAHLENTNWHCDLQVSDILLVDSSLARRRSVSAALGHVGYRFIEATTTSEALASIAGRRIDLVLIDLQAPGLGAIGFCKTIRQSVRNRLLPVFVLGRSGNPETEILALDSGADGFISAPIRAGTLRARVQASLRQKALVDELDESEAVLFSLAEAVEQKDPSLGQHCARLASMASALGTALGLSDEDISALRRGAYLHDIGKIGIPDSVLFKPGPLTPEEWQTMKSHPERGERICSRVPSLARVLPIIRHHHEKWDGTGYPDGLTGEQIPLLARILQTVDIYDGLTAVRPYKPAFSSEEALQILQEEARKGWRDPNLVAAFSAILPSLQTQTAPKVSDSSASLQALASSLDRFRKPAGAEEPTEAAEIDTSLPLASGL